MFLFVYSFKQKVRKCRLQCFIKSVLYKIIGIICDFIVVKLQTKAVYTYIEPELSVSLIHAIHRRQKNNNGEENVKIGNCSRI